jgi:hypothetical protein
MSETTHVSSSKRQPRAAGAFGQAVYMSQMAQLKYPQCFLFEILSEPCTAELVVGTSVDDSIVCLSTDLWNTMMVVWVSKVRIPRWGACNHKQSERAVG